METYSGIRTKMWEKTIKIEIQKLKEWKIKQKMSRFSHITTQQTFVGLEDVFNTSSA